MPLPAAVKFLSLLIYEKLESNEVTLRSEGTLPVVVVPGVFPPHAMRINPTAVSAGTNRTSFM
jgi:hypothetical protein